MNIVGIDVSKDTLVGVRINRSGLQKEKYSLKNTYEAIISFLAILQSKHKRLVIACESTGDFHRQLAFACFEKEIPFRLINPITTQQFIKVTVRGHKTDLSDAYVIAKLALQGEGRYKGMILHLPSQSVAQLQNYPRWKGLCHKWRKG